MVCAVLIAIVMGLVGQDVWCHDFWIEPSTFMPKLGSPAHIRLMIGEDFKGDSLPRDPSHIKRFLLAGPGGESPIVGLSGSEPAGYVRFESPGLHVIGYRSRERSITLEAEQFESYLAEEGLEEIVRLRAHEGKTQQPAREIFSRCAKSLLVASQLDSEIVDLQLGFTLELMAEKNPYSLAEGQTLPVRLLYRDEPLEGVRIVALSKEKPDKKLMLRSDPEGRVLLQLPRGRTWLVKAVHMIPAPKGAGADWESIWASLTFRIP